MGRILHILFSLLIASQAFSQVYNRTDEKNYLDSTFTQILEGEIVEKYHNGNVKSVRRYKNGKAHGEFLTFYPNGQLNSKSYF